MMKSAPLIAAVLATVNAQWTHPYDVVITHPANASAFNTGEAVLIQWIYNENVTDLDTFRLDLFSGDETNDVLLISSTVTRATGQLLFTFPGSLPTGEYWFGVSKNLVMRGYGPYPHDGTFGTSYVDVTQTGSVCTNHTTCATDEYCDQNSICTICDECFRWFDAIDFVCPSKCGTTPAFNVGSSIPDTSEADASGLIDDFLVPGCPAYNRLVINTNSLLSFAPTTAADEPTRMSVRLHDKLNLLAATAAGETIFTGYRIHVRAAYKSPPTDGSTGTLHHAGRAAELTIVNVSSPSTEAPTILYQFLGRLAAFNGLDYVLFANSNTLYISVIPDGCRTPLDLALLLDGSGSIELAQYGGAPGNFDNRILGFAKALVPFFNYGTLDNQTRMSVTTFSSSSATAVNFHLNEHDTASELLAAIDQIPYPRGGTATSVGIDLLRTSVFTEANGMRAATVGIPRVTIVITDGQSNTGFAPLNASLNLKGDPVNSMMISIGVGTRYSASELEDMASAPVQQNVYTLKSFDRVPAIVDKISFTACRSRPIIDSGTDTSGSVDQCEFVFFQSQCGHLENSVIEVTSTSGMVHVYVDNSTSPGPFRYLFKDESNDVRKSVVVTRAAGETSPLYIGVKGVGTGTNTFSIRVFSNFFSGSTTTNVSIAEDASVGAAVFTPPFTPGATYTILSGNEGSPAPFAISASSGAITVNSGLDFETTSSYSLRVSAVNNVAPCQNGIMFINVNVTDINDVVPTFVGAPFSASVAINTPANVEIFTAQATDTDGGSLVYSMTVTEVLRKRERRQTDDFAIDPSTGVITTTTLIDGSTTDYELDIEATDGTFTGTARLDVTVTPCDTCPGGQFASACSGGTTTVVCTNVGLCDAGQFMAADATPTSDRDCQPCPAGQFQTATDHTLTSCTPFNPCPAGEIETAPGTPTSDRQCEATLQPTAPTSAAPTPPPTPPTPAPTETPTTAAPTTLSPTESPTTFDVSAQESSSGGQDVMWWPALLVLLVLLMVLAALVMRNKKKVDDPDVKDMGAGNPLYGDFQMGHATAGRAALMNAVGNLNSKTNPLWAAFRRCVAFDIMYYGNPPLKLDDEALRDVYNVLQLASPDDSTLGKLRTIGRRFLDTKFVPKEKNTALHEDVNDFFWAAIADEMIERAIDAMATCHEYDASSGGVKPSYEAADATGVLAQCLSDLTEDYVPEANPFLVPVQSDPSLRQLPPSDNNFGDSVYEMAGAKAHAELDYALAAGANAGGVYDVANESANNEYAISNADDLRDSPEDVYAMASSGAETDVVYDMGGLGSHNHNGGGGGDPVYDMGGTQGLSSSRTGGDMAIYDNRPHGGGSVRGGRDSAHEAVYDIGTNPGGSSTDGNQRPTSAIYDIGGVGGSIEVDDDIAVYDNRPNAIPDDLEDDNATDMSFDMGRSADGYLGLGGTLSRNSSDTGTLTSRGVDATYADGASGEYLTLPRGDATLKSHGTLVPEVYDIGESDNQPVARYSLAESDDDDMTGVQVRSKSYDNALNDI